MCKTTQPSNTLRWSAILIMIGLTGLKFRKEAFTSVILDMGPPPSQLFFTKNDNYNICAIQDLQIHSQLLLHIFFYIQLILTIHFSWIKWRLINNRWCIIYNTFLDIYTFHTITFYTTLETDNVIVLHENI